MKPEKHDGHKQPTLLNFAAVKGASGALEDDEDTGSYSLLMLLLLSKPLLILLGPS